MPAPDTEGTLFESPHYNFCADSVCEDYPQILNEKKRKKIQNQNRLSPLHYFMMLCLELPDCM